MDDRARTGGSSRVVVKEEERSSFFQVPSHLVETYGRVMPLITGASSSRVVVKEEERSSFFQVPSHLVETYGGVMPSKVTLTTDESEKRWKLSVEEFQGEYFFTDGWKEFEEGVGLEFRRFLMYKPDASSKQKCEDKKRRKIRGTTHGATNLNLRGAEKKLSFSKEMRKHHKYRLDIPENFVGSTGICEGDIIILKDFEGKEWPVHVTKRAAVLSLSGGWCNFVRDSRLMMGSKILFVWLSGSTILTRILEVGSSKQLLLNSSCKRRKRVELLEWDKTSDEAELSENSLLDVKSENEDDISKENCTDVGRNWTFSKVLKKEHAYTLNLPLSFSTVVGKATRGEIELMDCERRMWPVKYNSYVSFRLCTGWIDFLVGNKTSIGSTVVFESIPDRDEVIKARVIEDGNKQKQLFVKRARGRPHSCSSKRSPMAKLI